MQRERRQHRRLKVKDNAFAVINPDPVKMVPIIDIGMGGLGIYVNNGAKWIDDCAKLEIMVADCSFYLNNLPFEIIANLKAFPWDNSSVLDGRRYSLKFGNLRPVQISRLKYFIRNYTRGSSKLKLLRSLSNLLHPNCANNYSGQTCSLGIRPGSQ
jgi:hypothetical protein